MMIIRQLVIWHASHKERNDVYTGMVKERRGHITGRTSTTVDYWTEKTKEPCQKSKERMQIIIA